MYGGAALSDRIRFWFRGRLVEVDDAPVTLTVLDWLRREPTSRGTKEGCNEGDCGACTVVVGTPTRAAGVPGRPDGLRLATVNSCLALLPTLHGRALLTIEDVAPEGDLHPVQQAMVDLHGTQCGFCTPGIVMSLWCMDERSRASGRIPSRADLADGLAGNLCRCTGYRSVLEAAQQAVGRSAGGTVSLDTEPILAGLADVTADDVLDYECGGTTFLAPVTVDGLVDALASRPDSHVLAGGTDLVLGINQLRTDVPSIVWTGRVGGLADVDQTDTHLVIGAGASLEEAWAALAARAPALSQMWLRFASPAIRNTGTMGGNLVNGSPIGDSAPVLLALDARLVLRGVAGTRVVDLGAFYTGYGQTMLAPGEVLERIEVPLSAFDRDVRAYKLSRRFDSDISAVSGCFAAVVTGAVVTEVRLAFGGMDAVVRRSAGAEAALLGAPWTQRSVTLAQEALAGDFTPMSDHRGSAGYRMRVAQGLLERWWLQTRPTDALATSDTEVWGRP
jgi:xanthine dehydrogenase small subunit